MADEEKEVKALDDGTEIVGKGSDPGRKVTPTPEVEDDED